MTQTPITTIITEEAKILKEDWHVVLAVWGTNALAVVATSVFAFPVALLGVFLIGGVGAALAAWFPGGLPVGFLVGMAALGLVLSFIGIVVAAFIRGGVVSVLRTRKPGMQTSFEVFLEHAKKGFYPTLRILFPLWLGIVFLLIFLFGGLLVIFYGAVALAGGWQGTEGDEIAAAIFLLLLAFFPFLACAGLALFFLQMVTGYALYAGFENPLRSVQENYNIGFQFIQKNFGSVAGFHALFWIISIAASTVLQTVFTPLLILSYIPFIGFIFSIPTGLLMTAASLLMGSASSVWMESGNMRLFRERRMVSI